MKVSNRDTSTTSEVLTLSYEMYFFYDSYGHLSVIDYFKQTADGTERYTYYVATNLSGDVLALYGADGVVRVKYEYDAWGNVISVTNASDVAITSTTSIAHRNPIRYRGYVYDTDTKLYYLQSRYYNPEIGRFLNADSITDGGSGVLGNNLFIYAANNPINNSDPTGHWIIKDGLKWLSKNILQPALQKAESIWGTLVKGTISKGVSLSGSLFVQTTCSVDVACDSNGGIAITTSRGNGAGLPSFSASVHKATTNAPSVKELSGTSYQCGGSIDVNGISIGCEGTTFTNQETKQTYWGGAFSAGVGFPGPVDFYINQAETEILFYFNLFDTIEEGLSKVEEW